MSYAGADRPAAIVAAPIRGARRRRARRAVRRPRPRRDARRGRRRRRRRPRRDRRARPRHGEPLRGRAPQRRADGRARRRRRQAPSGADRPALALVARAALEAVGRRRGADPRARRRRRTSVVTRGVHARTAALAAELEGTRVPLGDPAARASCSAGADLLDGRTHGQPPSPARCVERLGPIEAAGAARSSSTAAARRGARLIARRGAALRARRPASLAPAVATPRCSSCSTVSAVTPNAAPRRPRPRPAGSARRSPPAATRRGSARLLARLVADAIGAAAGDRLPRLERRRPGADRGLRVPPRRARRRARPRARARGARARRGDRDRRRAASASRSLAAGRPARAVGAARLRRRQVGALQLLFPDRDSAHVALAQRPPASRRPPPRRWTAPARPAGATTSCAALHGARADRGAGDRERLDRADAGRRRRAPRDARAGRPGGRVT